MKNHKTFVLMWNPEVSSYTLEQCIKDFNNLKNKFKLGYIFNWSVWDWAQMQKGDNVVLVNCGNQGNKGIVLIGNAISKPYLGEDWSGKGRDVHYVDIDIQFYFHPIDGPVIGIEELQKVCPDFDWTGGHSGRMIEGADDKALNDFICDFLSENYWFGDKTIYCSDYDNRIYACDDENKAALMYAKSVVKSSNDMRRAINAEKGAFLAGVEFRKLFDNCYSIGSDNMQKVIEAFALAQGWNGKDRKNGLYWAVQTSITAGNLWVEYRKIKNGEIIGSDDQEASQNLYKYVTLIGDARLTASQNPGKVTENLIVDNIVRMMRLEDNFDEDLAIEKDMYDRAWEIYHDNEKEFRLAANIGEELVPVESTEWGNDLDERISEFPLSHFMDISLATDVANRLYDLKHKSENK